MGAVYYCTIFCIFCEFRNSELKRLIIIAQKSIRVKRLVSNCAR